VAVFTAALDLAFLFMLLKLPVLKSDTHCRADD